ncbi:MAG: bifunctional phosphoglucose/phosphomannose isomerase [Candidatus Eiseniibacteriota bacterium]|nr:MAG: bifunctional phosphoglucose/phosphomannose isomerase [Candidatus Eisenbacteria bacterium]
MILDAPAEMRRRDPSGMLRLVRELPEQIENALEVCSSSSVPVSKSKLTNVVVGGLGGSAIAGDILRGLMEERGSVPCFVVREYRPPGYVGPGSLVFCSSYSGNTEETLSLYDAAKEKGAELVCLGSGGELQRRAAADGIPFLKMEEGFPPRAAIGYSVFMIYDVLRRASFVSEAPGELEEMLSLLRGKSEDYGEEKPTSENPAKSLAAALHEKLIVVYGTRLFASVAMRWKCQFNENSKALAFANVFPELNHNEIEGWLGLRSLHAPAQIVTLRDSSEHPRVSKRIGITLELIRTDGCGTLEVWSEGESLLARIFSLIYLGDFASIYLAFLRGEDPTPVARIQELKRRLSEGTGR